MRFYLDGESFELTPDDVRSRLKGHRPEAIRTYWVEIHEDRWPIKQVIAIATGITDRGRFQSQSARRWLVNLGFTVEGERAQIGSAAQHKGYGHVIVRQPDLAHELRCDVVLVGCVKSKRLTGAAAKDLYTSNYFSMMRNYAESLGRPWFILSAEHGLVDPDQWLEPYDLYLPSTSSEYRRAWGQSVVTSLAKSVGPLNGLFVDIHAGAAYVEAVCNPLQQCGATLVDQLEGLSFGRRLSWYRQRESQDRLVAESAITSLLAHSSSRTLQEVLATGGDELRVPGMYSWWVDPAGAGDLTRGLGHEIEAGLVYVGLAGATRRGGSTSSNTLWGRIATMHLGKKHEFSTLRFSLGSVLANGKGQSGIDESSLTEWMLEHMRLIALPVADAESLGELESAVLRRLDPPLNLAKVDLTPLRCRLSQLRKQFGNRPRSNKIL